MNKNELIKKYLGGLISEPEDKIIFARIRDKLEACEKNHMITYSKFLNERQRALAEQLLKHSGSTRNLFFGGYDGALRTVLVFLPDYIEPDQISEEEYSPLAFIRASYSAENQLSHRDFLGSLMGLGIQRDTVGDILPGENSCDLIVLKEISPFILANLSSAGKAKLKLTSINYSQLQIPEPEFKLVRDTVASLRLDNIVSSGYSISREKASEAIRAGKVTVNHLECAKPDKTVGQGDRISLRGMGKIEFCEVGYLTKKGRISVTIKKY